MVESPNTQVVAFRVPHSGPLSISDVDVLVDEFANGGIKLNDLRMVC